MNDETSAEENTPATHITLTREEADYVKYALDLSEARINQLRSSRNIWFWGCMALSGITFAQLLF